MLKALKQSTAATLILGPFVDTADGFTAKTALTLAQADIRLSKAAGAFAQKGEATTATHMENGYYSTPINSTDTGTLGILTVAVNKTGAMPVRQDYAVVPANVYEALVANTEFLSTTGLEADFTISGTTLTVRKKDGSTTQYTKTISTNAAADPIVGLD